MSAATQRSKRESMRFPSSSGDAPTRSIAATARSGGGRSAASARAASSVINTPAPAIHFSKECPYSPKFPRDAVSSGASIGKSAPGGYSTAKSRYGTCPAAIASPYVS